MSLRLLYITALLALAGCIGSVDAASLQVRRQDGATQFTAELGETVDMEVAIDVGVEEITGVTFFLSYDREVFRLIPADEDEIIGEIPFAQAGFLRGIVLVNQVEMIDGESFLSYTEATGGLERQAATGMGVVARFRLEVLRRPVGNATRIRVESRGHDRVSHYMTEASPGVEIAFSEPLGETVIQITGFRILPLPDVVLIEGESRMVFDLDSFVDSTAGEVIWTHSRLSEVPTVIDSRSGEVTMNTPSGKVGKWAMIFTAFETSEGLTAADTVEIDILSRPKIVGNFSETISFPEDEEHREFDLDAFVEDIDDLPEELTWSVSAGSDINATIDVNTHIVTFSASPDFFGTERLTFVVGDGDGLRDTVSIPVVVTPVNDPPQVKRVPPIYPIQGGDGVAVLLVELVEDRDDDLGLLQFSLEPHEGLRVDVETDRLVIFGELAGRRIVGFTVQDTAGAVDQGRQVAVVLEPGAQIPPAIGSLPEMRLTGNQSGTLMLDEWVQDDGPTEALTWVAEADSGLIASVLDRQLRVSGESGFVGTSRVRLTATDGDGNQGRGVLTASLLRPDDGLGPKIFHPGKIGLRAGEEVTLDLAGMVADPDDADEVIVWSAFTTAGLEFDTETGILNLKEGEELAEPASLTLVAADPLGATDEKAIFVLVVRSGEPLQVRDFPDVRLDSLEAEIRLDLDEFAFDDQDFEAELVWEAVPEPGVSATVDPVSHVLKIQRAETGGIPPAVTQVLLKVVDTAGQEVSRILRIGLPPLFELLPIPDVELIAGQIDTSLILDDFAVSNQAQMELTWASGPAEHIDIQINQETSVVLLASEDPAFQGSETVAFTATDPTGRSLSTPVRIIVKGTGLAPQVRALPRAEIEVGQIVESVDLDDYVVDDDPDDQLVWSAGGQQSLTVEIDSQTHVVTLGAVAGLPGVEQIQLLVRDPAGHSVLSSMEVLILSGGKAPEISPLPQILLAAGGEEKQLDLTPYVSDEDTPTAEISWELAAEAGVAGRIEGSRLIVSVPAGQQGTRNLQLTAVDPQGNRMGAEMKILIEEDSEPPVLMLEVGRHPVFSDLLELEVRASETLRQAPEVRVDGDPVEVVLEEDSYLATFPFQPQEEEGLIEVAVRAFDRGGNEANRQLNLALSWMDEGGGNVQGPDPQVRLNVPEGAAGPGQLALLYRLGEEDKPANSGEEPVYAIGLARRQGLSYPVTLNFFAGTGADPDLGILRWNEEEEVWEELPTVIDEETGWLSASVAELGLFKLGPVAEENRRANSGLHCYPNPFIPSNVPGVEIAYQVAAPGAVRLELFNSLGQPVRLLVDGFQEVGTWTTLWDGRDENGGPVGSGVYFYELNGGGQRECRSLVLIR
jgi:hypothetical protein